MARNSVVNDEAARKRKEIGLSERRATARSNVLRPPTTTMGSSIMTVEAAPISGFGGWWLVLFVALLALTTFLLIAARFLQSPTDLPTVNADVVELSDGRVDLQKFQRAVVNAGGEIGQQAIELPQALRLFDDFDATQSLLAEGDNATRSQRVIPELGVYLMRVEGHNAAWSLLGTQTLSQYRLETSARIAFDQPTGSAGLITRFVDADHFYLFSIDGAGRFEILHAAGAGNWQQLLPSTLSSAINLAGVNNVLEVVDQGASIRFSVNGTPLFQHFVPVERSAETGDAGLWTAASGDHWVEVEFDRIRLESLENP